MTDADNLERELKFPCAGLSGLREKLIEAEAERVAASALEDNLLFDRDGEYEKSGCVLRLRQDSSGALLTFKGPARYEEGTKIRLERETRLDDGEAMREILERLGFEFAYRYQKFREEWRVGGVTVCLDHTPIGDFTEFEGEGAERLAKRFGFDAEEAERRNYVDLYRDHREEHPDSPEHMVFEE